MHEALRGALQVVTVELEGDDDPQVIFETLNARGEPLLPSDLLRNFIFLRAAQKNESQEELYSEFWLPFDDEFWRRLEKQGRLHTLIAPSGYCYVVVDQSAYAGVLIPTDQILASIGERIGFRVRQLIRCRKATTSGQQLRMFPHLNGTLRGIDYLFRKSRLKCGNQRL